MNRKLLALAVGAALALPLAAQAAPTLYGQLNLSLDKVDFDGGPDQFEVNSNASRIGVMGEESLGNGLSAVYKVEGVVDGSGDIGYDWDNRDRYLGLKGAFGTIKMGMYDSPLKSSQGTVDQFNDMVYLDMANVIYGDYRMANLIGYESPKLADAITIKVALQPGEDTNSNGIADVFSASVAYEANGLYLAAAADQGDGQNTTPGKAGTVRDTIRLTGTYTMDALQLGALVQTSKLSDGAVDNKEQSLLVSAAYTVGKNVFKGEVIDSKEEDLGPDDEKTMLLALGMDHNFTQMTKVFGQAGMVKIDSFGGVSGDDRDATVFKLGMQTKF